MRQKAMALRHELQVLYHMLVAPIRGASHAERLESFYGGQAEGYDAFRARLLYGRRELWTQLPVPAHGIWVDMGGGTGANVLYVEAALPQLARLYIVDLSPSLLHVARQRIQAQGWTQVTAVEADATRFVPPEGPVDVVTFTYSLTMIPDWFAALDHAWEILRPGGIIGVVDFYVSRKYPTAQQRRHLWLTRAFWPLWFSFDNVFPSPDHVPYLHNRFEMQTFSEHTAPVPYLPGLRVPYYLFIGQKPAKPTDDTASSQPTDTMGGGPRALLVSTRFVHTVSRAFGAWKNIIVLGAIPTSARNLADGRARKDREPPRQPRGVLVGVTLRVRRRRLPERGRIGHCKQLFGEADRYDRRPPNSSA